MSKTKIEETITITEKTVVAVSPKTATVTRTTTASSTLSGRRPIGIKNLVPSEKTEKVTVVSDDNLPKDEFSLILVESFWRDYISELKKKGEFLIYNALHHISVSVKEDYTLHFKVPSNAAQDDFIKQQPDILLKVRKYLNNYYIKITTEIIEIQQNKVLYSPEEKFKFLVEKNPAIEKLRTKLGLDIYE